MIALVFDHLWQSTLFAGGAALLTLALRGNSAAVRFLVWFAASVKFLVPFAVLTLLGNHILGPIASLLPAPGLMRIDTVAEPFSGIDPVLVVSRSAVIAPAGHGDWTILLLVLWGTGFALLCLRWFVRWSRLRRLLHEATDLKIAAPIAVKCSRTYIEPGLVGIVRPIILLPRGIEDKLSPAELNAILAHELCHWRRRDAISVAIQTGVEALFWFHPLVWWIGRRLVVERENACDEAVLTSGNDPRIYAESILKVCKFSLHSPLAYVPGVASADLRMRLENIMENRSVLLLSRFQKGLLGACAAIALAVPLSWGLLTTSSAIVPAASQASGIPHPGTEAALRRQIAGWEMKQPDFAGMGTGLAEATREQRTQIQKTFDDWGAVKSITFKGNDGDNDVYLVQFEKNLVAYTIGPLQNGKVVSELRNRATLRADGGPSPGVAAAIRRTLEGNYAGKPALEVMSPSLQLATQRQWPVIAANAAKLGAVQAVTFQKVNLQGWDLYSVTFANGTEIAKAMPLVDGRLGALVYGDILLPRAAQHSGTEAWLRRYIAAQRNEMPDYEDMKPGLAHAVAVAWPLPRSYFQALGDLRALTFEGGGHDGTDVYLATFQNGKLLWRLEAPDADGKLEMVEFQKLDANSR